jgi:hypothetical protein
MKPTLFIHTSKHEILAAKVALYSHLLISENTDHFDVKIIQIEDEPYIMGMHGRSLIRNGREGAWYNDVPQSFLPLRFIVPKLMNYKGRAVLTDPDVFAVEDIYELLTKEMGSCSILCRTHGRGVKGRNSSVMLLDCEALENWTWEDKLDDLFSGRLDLQDWITLQTENPASIGDLEEKWNHYDKLDKSTKLLHNTNQITQPWKTGLPYNPDNMSNHIKRQDKQGIVEKVMQFRGKGKKAMLSALKNTLLVGEPRVYKKHPDSNQELLFFAFLKDALQSGFITSDFVRLQIKQGYVRPDILHMATSAKESPKQIISRVKDIDRVHQPN